MERRLAAILAADVVGYSRLMGEDEAGTLERLKACEAAVIEPAVARHGGRIVKRMGDGYLVEFASVVAAVECALAWQRGASPPLAFRIAIHLGDVMVQEGDLYGEGINIAARLEALAKPGGLCLSEDAQRQVRGKIQVDFEDIGPQQLKNIAEPIRVFRALVEGAAAAPPSGAATGQGTGEWRMPRILLLPFRHLGNHGDSGAFASGLTETLAAALAHFEEFELIDPGSAREVIADQGTLGAGRQLEAAYLLEGSVQIALGKARIGVQLIDVAKGERVWSETLDRSFDDAFALQDEITAFVASTMGEAVGEEQARAISHKADGELKPYELMVRGMQHLHRVNREDNEIARDHFERLLALRPDHHLPAVCLCWTYVIELASGWPPSRPDALAYCQNSVRDLLRQHDRSAHLHRLMSRISLITGDQDQGLAHAERAYRLNPYHSDMVMTYGISLLWTGRAAEGVGELERAFAINPYAPAYYKTYLSLAYYLVGRHEAGLEILESIGGAVLNARSYRIANLVALDRMQDARAEARILLRETPTFDLERMLAGLPFQRVEDRQRLGEALRQAGLSSSE
ncbi:MAG: adenylate/guanylate cyclase domain-containing protein [Rhodospirillales bacterium]